MRENGISVFFPCINEEGNIISVVEKAEVFLKKRRVEYEIIIVDDGSTDKTGQIADELAWRNSRIRVIHHPKNLGYGEALKSGFYNAVYDIIVYTDGDGQFDFSETEKFLEKIKDNDLVIGFRKKRQDSFLRKLFGRGWRLTLLLFFRLTLKDVDCGFKIVRREVLEKIPHLESSRGAMINAELAIKAKKMGFRIVQVGVNHYPRLSGRPTGANFKVILKSYIDLLKLWWKLKNEKWVFLGFLAVLLLAGFLRFYRLADYMTFLGDEGRDAIVIKNMLVNHHFPLIGPPMSVGNIYLGPLYYYMMAVPMFIFWLNPVAAVGMNALLGLVTIGLIYYLGKKWFGKTAGLIASYFYAISPVTVIYSRSSWNPNPTPFFTLIAVLSLYKLHQTGNFLWFILTGLSVGAALQMHYLSAILIPIVGLIWLYEVFHRKRNKLRIKQLLGGTLLGILSFFLIMSPLIWFDLRHNFLNYRAITELLTSGSEVKANIFVNVIKIPVIYFNNLIGRYIGGENLYLTGIAAILALGVFLHKSFWPRLILAIWLVVGLFGLSFYQQSIYDHYLNFLNPVPFLLLGASVMFILGIPAQKKLVSIGIIILLLVLTVFNLQKNPLFRSPNNQLKRTQDVARFVISQTGGRDFNFALIAKSNYDSAYQFYLDRYGHKPKQVPFDITDQLFVVCEDEVCDPTHNAKYELAAFGMSKIDWMKEAFGVKIYKLSHNPSGIPQ